MPLLQVAEPSDRWRLLGVDDASTPPSLSRVLFAAGTRAEWRRAGFPVLFDENGEARPIVRAGRAYPFVPVNGADAEHHHHPEPIGP